MSKSRKVSIIIGTVMLLIIASGFLYLAIKIKTIPEIECIQSGDVKGHEDMYINMPIAKSWNDSGFHANQYDAVLTNNTYNVLKDWSVTLKLPNNAKINDSWNISFYENDDGTITIYNTPNQGYNDVIESKGNITFGFILFS
ncbi:MAG: cellulose binding domain-containing protein, partial [Lachnospiraceae bacterium]|nr:cellulose binding domain-containing protein [Lachnospiraceae bacterium]